MAGLPAWAFAAMAATPAMSVGAHSLGSPSVASSTTTLWVGLARASACACATAPDSAPDVGVSPSGVCWFSELTSAAAAPGSGATSTAGAV